MNPSWVTRSAHRAQRDSKGAVADPQKVEEYHQVAS